MVKNQINNFPLSAIHNRSVNESTKFNPKITNQFCGGEKVILMLFDLGCVFGYRFYHQHLEKVSRLIGVDISDYATCKSGASRMNGMSVVAYQNALTLAWKIGGKVGDAISHLITRLFKYPATLENVSSKMNDP